MACTCQRCGKKFEIDVYVDDVVWEKIKPAGKPKGAGLLCPICIMEELIRAIKTIDGKQRPDSIKIELMIDGLAANKEVGRLMKRRKKFFTI
jgi:hypothetical protein